MKDEIVIYDSTLREGGQSMQGGGITSLDMADIAQKLAEFGIDLIEGPWPVPESEVEEEKRNSAEKAKQFYKLMMDSSIKEKIVVFGSTREKGITAGSSLRLNALVQTGLNNFAIFGKSWDRHVEEVIKTSMAENLKMIEESVRFLKSKGGRVFYDAEHFFDGYFANQGYAVKTLRAAIAGGADMIILCDTNGGMLPWKIKEVLEAILPQLAETNWGIHCHNDGDLALANTLEAIRLGALCAQITINGESERVGMPKGTSLIPTLYKMGIKCRGITNMKGLKALAEFIAEKNNMPLPDNQPIVGDNAFAHKAGSHRAGAVEDPTLQEHIKPDLVGAQRRFPISGLAGPNGILDQLNRKGIDLTAEPEIAKKLYHQILKMDSRGFHIESAPSSFWLMAKRLLRGYTAPFNVTLVEVRSNLHKQNPHKPFKWNHDSRALLEVYIPNKKEPIRLWAEGDEGPVAALDSALRPALIQSYPILEEVSLVDYKVRILTTNGKGTSSKVRVSIGGATPFGYEITAGMSENIILASALALMDLYEVVILKSLIKK